MWRPDVGNEASGLVKEGIKTSLNFATHDCTFAVILVQFWLKYA
jgi:hypothetical protein